MAMITALLITSLLIFSVPFPGNALSLNYYDETCPGAEAIITKAVKEAMTSDKTAPAALLRMHFHDCFIRGCDASILLSSVGKNTAEKDGPPNVSLHAFYVIHDAKKQVEALCPGVVSCADILALAVFTGGHTLGFAHCSSFRNRIHFFNTTHDIDPSLHPSFAASLKSICPIKNKVKNAGTTMDPSSTTFDNTYYKLILQQKSLFSSDQALLTSPKTKDLVSKFASSQEAFSKAFVKSMIKMSSITGGQEVRKDCNVVN